MTKVTSEDFLRYVEKSRLVEDQAIAGVRKKLLDSHNGQYPEDPVEVAKAFESEKLLTRWHSEKLLQGRYKGFFLGKYKLLGHLGTGGMSTVYLAEHTVMQHKLAVKVLPKSKLGKNSYLQRFRQEAKAIASLNHPNIVRAFDIDNEKDTHYLVMEYVEGADLQTVIRKKGPLPYEIAAEYISQAAKGLQHAHDMGLIHRDVKPANLLINREGVIKVLDLGLALYADESQASLTMEHNDKVLGTADYLAPEQAINSHNIDHRADIYSLGCSLYFLLTGHPPFPQGSIAQRIMKHQTEMPDDIRKKRPDCPGELDGICVKMMQKDRRFRYQTCTQVAEQLDTWLAAYKKQLVENKAKAKAQPVYGAVLGTPVEGPGSSVVGGASYDMNEALGLGSSGIRSQRELDTVSNRGGDTNAGSSGLRSGSFAAMSASESGELRAIAMNGGSDIKSRIDLEHDTHDPNPHHGSIERPLKLSNTAKVPTAPVSNSTLKKPGQPAAIKKESKPAAPATVKQPTKKVNSAKNQKQNVSLLTLFLVIATIIGLFCLFFLLVSHSG